MSSDMIGDAVRAAIKEEIRRGPAVPTMLRKPPKVQRPKGPKYRLLKGKLTRTHA